MEPSFTYQTNPSRVLFGTGKIHAVADELNLLGCTKALVISTPNQKSDALQLAKQLGDASAGVFAKAAMHTPVEVTNQALDKYEKVSADAVIALGGGSTVGLSKALALRTGTKQIVIPTTYAGSEVTPILGQTEDKLKTTIRNKKVLPDVVIYDPELSVKLPVIMSVNSGLNAMAHAIEALYAKDRNPISTLMAIKGVQSLHSALPGLVSNPTDLTARGDALIGAWLCGTVLGAVGMSLHHKLCHALGGSFNLPHAETHAILLAHSVGYNALAAQEQLAPLQEIFGTDIASGIYQFSRDLGAPLALKNFGLQENQLNEVVDLALQQSYWNPRPLERQSMRNMLQNAWQGTSPQSIS